jgi:serine/threonine protein kinase/lipoprotein NlpI
MLNNRYQIIRKLGFGGWGEVSLALDNTSGKQVAIKRIDPVKTASGDSLQKEIDALSRLNHPHVIKYIESFVAGNSPYLVTEYVPGITLEERLKQGPLALLETERYSIQILDALGYIHSQGIVHSDLKPANIIIDSDNSARLIDFGIIRTASAEIAADIKEIRGTLHYMSPEQAEGSPYDVRSDLFSFGVVLYELCTGTKPFSGNYDMAVIYAILYEEPVPPEKINAAVSPALSDTIKKLLAKNPSDRPGSVAVFREALKGAFTVRVEVSESTKNRIAILPCDYPPGDNDSALVADGLKDELYARLRQLDGLSLISPIKVARYAQQLTDGPAVRTLLGADYYITGSVRRLDETIRIYLLLSSSVDDSIIWSEKFDDPLSSFFNVIDLITERVIARLRSQLTTSVTVCMPTSSTTVPEAYELYLLARGYYVKYTGQDLEYARNMYLQALELDPQYALACVGVADCYCGEYMSYCDRRDEVLTMAAEWARKALEIIPDLPEAYRTLGRIMQTTGRVKQATEYYLKAVTYKEDFYQAYRSLGWLAKDCFRYDEALNWVRKALSINSIDLETIFLKGVIRFEQRESKQAINDFTRCIELRPDYSRAHSYRGMTYFQLGRIADAVSSMTDAVRFGGDINAPYLLGYYYLCDGAYQKCTNALLDAAKYHEIAFLAGYYLGVVCYLTHDRAAALEAFQGVQQQCEQLIRQDPDFHIAKAILAESSAFIGEYDRCHALVKEVLPYAVYDGSMAHEIARSYAVMGEKQMARELIARAIGTCRGPTQYEIERDPILNHFLKAES